MSNIPMLHPVTAETVQNYAVNSGMLVRNMDFTGITDAETFLAALTTEGFRANILGATSGSTTISENRETWSPDHNGLRIPFKGSLYLDTAQPSIKVTLVEMTPNNIVLASGAADIVGLGTKAVKIIPRATFNEGDYVGTLTWFTNYGTRGIIGATVKNALCTTGLNWSVDDKNIATAEVEFMAHSDSLVFTDELPIEYFIYYKTDTSGTAPSQT